jgi:hypothetical protein
MEVLCAGDKKDLGWVSLPLPSGTFPLCHLLPKLCSPHLGPSRDRPGGGKGASSLFLPGTVHRDPDTHIATKNLPNRHTCTPHRHEHIHTHTHTHKVLCSRYHENPCPSPPPPTQRPWSHGTDPGAGQTRPVPGSSLEWGRGVVAE